LSAVRPIVTIYCARLSLGIVAAVLSALLAMVRDELSFTTFMNGLTIALIVYLVSYYVFKPIFRAKVEKQSKIMMTGIGIYFFAWIVFMILFYSIFKPLV
jgi:hypothetical protein